jgi:glycosyltransferase involved in cell wall biosynthesis
MTRIGYLASQYPASSHTFIAREIGGLRRMGADIRTFSIRPGEPGVVLPDGEGPPCRSVLGLGRVRCALIAARQIAAHPLRSLSTLRLALRHRVPGWRSAVWALFHFAEALVLVRLLDEAGVDRLHVHFANSGATVALLAAHYRRMPWSMTLHGISETDYPAGQLLADKIARAEFVACASWFIAAQGARLAKPEHWARLVLVRCEIPVEAVPPDLAEPRSAQGRVRLIAVARLAPEKGLTCLLDAFARTATRQAATLTIVGDGPLRAALDRRATELGIAAQVRFAGRLGTAETMAEIAQHDALVLPSFMEGLPVVLIEALALGRPVIATQVAGIPEVVRHEHNGLLVPPLDVVALADSIDALVGSPALRRRLAANARASVAAEFLRGTSWQRLHERFARPVPQRAGPDR